ncbi:hypothetical protein B0T26DRAFT_753711 [Lasiosphaeria miniovina]|uniref:Uncharacterized protein n=1 Tax=Lasiosphaeria miniovina TaxID=1954250 RepID=A0AA40DU94_9PEZI|nr:uncharacterized protein B0T26DRAFT_753711 [Lasiosphaeria miniovina]KAK0713617.1 hypothetical protein B0T26DRAFT_753711 [Lasiosphaeria miniovina]
MSLLQLADLVGYNLPPVVAGILGFIKLRPAAALALAGLSQEATAASSDHGSDLWFVPCHKWRFILRMATEVDMEATSGMTAIGDFLKRSGLGDKVHVSDVLFTGTRVAEAVLETHIQTKPILATLRLLWLKCGHMAPNLVRLLGLAKKVQGRADCFASLSKLKALPTILVVGTVAPPFDQVSVVWMNRDISPAEVEVLNVDVTLFAAAALNLAL